MSLVFVVLPVWQCSFVSYIFLWIKTRTIWQWDSLILFYFPPSLLSKLWCVKFTWKRLLTVLMNSLFNSLLNPGWNFSFLFKFPFTLTHSYARTHTKVSRTGEKLFFWKFTLLTLDSFSKLRTKNGDKSFQQKFQNCFFLWKIHQSVNFFLLNLLLFQPKLNLQFGLYICRQNHFCASCLCRKKKISSDPVLLIGINRLIPFSRLTAAVSCWRICCHIEVLLNPEKDRKSE